MRELCHKCIVVYHNVVFAVQSGKSKELLQYGLILVLYTVIINLKVTLCFWTFYTDIISYTKPLHCPQVNLVFLTFDGGPPSR